MYERTVQYLCRMLLLTKSCCRLVLHARAAPQTARTVNDTGSGYIATTRFLPQRCGGFGGAGRADDLSSPAAATGEFYCH